MKKQHQIAISFIFLLVSILLSDKCNAQPKRAPEFSFEIEWNSAKTAFNLTIRIDKGQPNYTVTLFDNEPWENGNIVNSKSNTVENTITFLNLVPQNLYIQVYDATTLKSIKYLKINE